MNPWNPKSLDWIKIPREIIEKNLGRISEREERENWNKI